MSARWTRSSFASSLRRCPTNSWHTSINSRQLQTLRTFASEAKAPPPGFPKPKKSFFGRAKAAAWWTTIGCASCVAGVFAVGGAIFLHDAFTYTDRHVERVPVNPLALHPESGGPKNLPIARVLVGDEEDEVNQALSKKPRLVIVGGGWGVSTTRLSDSSDELKIICRLWASSSLFNPAIITLRLFLQRRLQRLHLCFRVSFDSVLSK